MTPERWKRIEELYDRALAREPGERERFLAEACGGDEDLRRDVESLLSSAEQAGDFLERPALEVAARGYVSTVMVDLTGRRLGRYEVLSRVGRGGMGEVYRARDTRLKRQVALKVLPPERLADPERKRRFEHEARAASALDHPNIVTIHDIDQTEGIEFIAMEYVEGQTLAERIGRKGLPVPEALKYAVQIADALAAAHQAGIVHRDLKPGNLMVTEKGVVKVLDFGLAKLAGATRITKSGTVLGTPAYMSPEQAEGKKVDARSDIFAFGSVLYEMVTGRRAFKGDSPISTLSAILHQEPAPPGDEVPRDLQKIIARCLRKDPERRFQYMKDLKVELEELKEESDSGALVSSAGLQPAIPRQKRALLGAGALVTLLAVALVAWSFLRRASEAPENPPVPVPFTTYPGLEYAPSFSPDGAQVAFSWNGPAEDNYDIYIKRIGPERPLRLTSHPLPERFPAWSPDGHYIAFLRAESGASTASVYLVPSLGGTERLLTQKAWKGLWALDRLDWSPDGRWLVFSDQAAEGEPFSLHLLSLETREKRRITSPPRTFLGDHAGSFSPDGRKVVFVRSESFFVGDLYELALSEQLTPAGEPRRLTFENIRIAHPIWTRNGRETIFWARGPTHEGLWRVGTTGSGKPTPLAYAGNGATHPAMSRDGRRLVYSQVLRDSNIWRINMPGPPVRFISSTRSDHQGRWSPDGKRIAFISDRSGIREIWVCDSDGSNPVQVTSLGAPHIAWPNWSPDGRLLVFESSAAGQRDIYVVSADGGAPQRITTDPADDFVPSWSRDGKWIYFCSSRTGKPQVWKVPGGGGKAVQVTKGGGIIAFESLDGKFLYYAKERGTTSLWKIPVDGGEASRVLDSITHAGFAIAGRGIYFTAADGHSIHFFSFTTGATKWIAGIAEESDTPGVSPDEKSILYTQNDQVGADLMLVENFR